MPAPHAPAISPAICPSITQRPVAYHDALDTRSLQTVTAVVIHCTELPDLEMAQDYAGRVHYSRGTGNCGHYYIDRDGSIQQYVAVDRIAHHVRGRNADSIGIELVNTGRYPEWFHSRHQAMSEPYPAPQMAALAQLLRWLPSQLPSLRTIAGHEDLDTTWEVASDDPTQQVPRKRDPGPRFPWSWLLEHVPLQRLRA